MHAGFERKRSTVKRVVIAGLLLIGFALPSWAPAQSAQSSNAVAAVSEKEDSPTQATDREKELADDTARLQVLANELKVELDKSDKDTLSVTVVKKAEEVEKLAHRVREEIKRSMGN